MSFITYVALLRGINVGGHKVIKMDDLRSAFEALKFEKVRTLLASGNVLFRSRQTPRDELASRIEAHLEKELGHSIGVLIRSIGDLEEMAAGDPFEECGATEDAKLYVSFLSAPLTLPFQVPFESTKEGFRITRVTSSEMFLVSRRLPNGRFGEPAALTGSSSTIKITTRNWNTVLRLIASARPP